jgi:hypothetical protein
MEQWLKDVTRQEWRELGFFYDRDDASKEWRLVGSCDGLCRFSSLLREYVADPRNEMKSEHEHYGPYSYLEVMTWPEAGFDHHAVRGPLGALDALASLVDAKIGAMKTGDKVRIGDEFAAGTTYALVLDLRDDDFDPSSLDANLDGDAG